MGILDTLRGTDSVGDTDSAPSSGGDQSSPDLSTLREEISSTRKPRADKGRPRGKRGVAVGDGTLTQEEVDALFTAENWEALAALPFDTRYVMTGWHGFRLTDDERKRIAQTTATTMKILLKIDPKYIALTVWGTMYFGTWAAKEAAYSKEKQAKAALSRIRMAAPDAKPATA